ncbi:hypothetical protein [Burkholderia cenocepacia]|nr:hypothetical protein [Burkholderia cenocepacia]MCW5141084.1 hypothetical protein [Burkholderia cenocepacia]
MTLALALYILAAWLGLAVFLAAVFSFLMRHARREDRERAARRADREDR